MEDHLRQSFKSFHGENPEVFRRLVAICRKLRSSGVYRYSMRTLIAVLRFENDIAGGERLCLNNNYGAYYARAIMQRYPEFRGFFKTRRAEGEDRKIENP